MNPHCLFCGGRLATDSRVCGRCGVVSATVTEKRVGARCPRCRDVRLRQFALGTVALQGCARCQGSFLPATEWDGLLDSFEHELLPEDFVITDAPPRDLDASGGSPYREASRIPVRAEAERVPSPSSLEAPVRCPTCEAEMERFEFNGVSGIIVDVCRLHGIWLDGGELVLVVENSRRSPAVTGPRIDQQSREDALRQDIFDNLPPGPSFASLLARQLAAVTRWVVSAVRGG